ncbi:flagellar motor switch protein FliG [Meinhardsimonia xiamenensis]|jgi:flagellar motor switch protein FliG|uniref:Flagellar motor switch protein FliG n=1 Tax=Meinhardsimonia xiamenensis TaxID=990712 RepID=A0A1G9H1R6_9RHOB|nr:flagellar motor switch protein FliG [Meinhardsimonia xiamenensis]SDL06896.1 flagellar motor switch protein FliG [Meinhardsimonia xiamenensis]
MMEAQETTGSQEPRTQSPRVSEDSRAAGLSRRTKAAIIVRLLQAEGMSLPLSELPEAQQTALARDMARLRYIDRATLHAVAREFADELEGVGLAFPGDIDRALAALEGQISEHAAAALRREAGLGRDRDPWARLAELDPGRLARVLEEESVEVGAVMLSKLPVPRAAELLGRIPGERARRISLAVSRTTAVRPETVQRIGQAILERLEAEPPSAFTAEPVKRLGAILNVSPAATRNRVLEEIEAEDANFAEGVRRAIFTFVNIPARIDPRDVPKITRAVEPAELVRALAAASRLGEEKAAAEFILANMSQRMAGQLREEMEELGRLRPEEGEAAMTAVVTAIRALEEAGEIVLTAEEG